MYLKGNYSPNPPIGKKIKKTINMPYIKAIVKNISTKSESLINEKFLIDTGAAISVLRNEYQHLFSDSDIVDETEIVYGSGLKKANIYKLIIKIEGNEYPIHAVIDNLPFNFSLLGNFDFLMNLDSVIFKPKQKMYILKDGIR